MTEPRDEGGTRTAKARTGSRLRCAECGTEIVVVRPPAVALVCCGLPMGLRTSGQAAS